MAKKNRLSPPLKKIKEKSFSELNTGDCCIDSSNDLLIKTSGKYEQSGVSLVTGIVYGELCDCQVVPVDITVAWKKK